MPLLLSNILIPDIRMGLLKLFHESLAVLHIEVDYLNAVAKQGPFTPNKGVVLPHDHTLDAVQDDRARAHGTGG